MRPVKEIVSVPSAIPAPKIELPAVRRWVRRHIWFLLTVPAVLFMLVVFAYPLARMLLRSIFDPEFTLEHYRQMVSVDAYAKVLINTIRISVVVTVLALVLGYPVAYVMSQARGIRSSLLFIGVVLPLWTSELVRTFAWTVILGRAGPLNKFILWTGITDEPLALIFNSTAVYIGSVHIMLPFMILTLYSVMQGIDPQLVRAAQSLGASPLAAFRHVYLPLSMPGVVSGVLLVFVLATGFFITPAVLGSPDETMISMLIESQGRRALNWGFASALSVALLVSTAIIIAVYNRVFGLDRLRIGGV